MKRLKHARKEGAAAVDNNRPNRLVTSVMIGARKDEKSVSKNVRISST